MSFGDVPFVKLRNSNEKNRKGSVLPLRSDIAAELRKWIDGKEPTDNVFYVSSRLLDILDRDIKAAGIPKIDVDGFVVHVHALRHSFGTHLSLANVAPRTAQAAMRHSSIDLTMNTYTDARLLGTAEAVETLPSFNAPTVAPTLGQEGLLESLSGNLGEITGDQDSHEKTSQTKGITTFDEIGLTRFELAISTPPARKRDLPKTTVSRGKHRFHSVSQPKQIQQPLQLPATIAVLSSLCWPVQAGYWCNTRNF